ncbi:MAG: cytochrome b/b6 domain-containing protein [Geminicoccales bacterium]
MLAASTANTFCPGWLGLTVRDTRRSSTAALAVRDASSPCRLGPYARGGGRAVSKPTPQTISTAAAASAPSSLGASRARVAWGFIGPEHARFTSFVRSPLAGVRYLLDLPRGRATRHLGHNPAGGWMVVVLLAMLTIVSGSGILMTTHRFWGDLLVEDIHYVSADITMGLIVLHVCGVIASSLAHRESLVLAMITGRKRVDIAASLPEAKGARRPRRLY